MNQSYFSFHFQTWLTNSSLLKSALFIPSEASILSTTNCKQENNISIKKIELQPIEKDKTTAKKAAYSGKDLGQSSVTLHPQSMQQKILPFYTSINPGLLHNARFINDKTSQFCYIATSFYPTTKNLEHTTINCKKMRWSSLMFISFLVWEYKWVWSEK